MNWTRTLFLGLLATLLCTSSLAADYMDPEYMLPMASRLTKLSTAVESAVRYKNPSAQLSEEALLKFATQHDPGLLAQFSELKIRVSSKNKEALLLICTPDGSRGLLEDVGCTAEMERHLWRDELTAPCEFTLDVVAVCASRAEAVALANAGRFAMPLPVHDFPKDSLIEISQAVWTSGVDRGSRKHLGELAEAPRNAALYLWMNIKGSNIALDRLAAEGKLPIRHKWFRETISSIRPEGVTQMTDNINLPAGTKPVLDGLRQEVRTRRFFDWHTWSSKENLSPGNWFVTVHYADNKPVLCGDRDGRSPCKFSIKVR